MGSPEGGYGIPKRPFVVRVPCRRKDFTTVGKMPFLVGGPWSITGCSMESNGECRVSDPVHLEHAVDERGLKAPMHDVTSYI